MQCPRCGAESDYAAECSACGIVFSKWKAPAPPQHTVITESEPPPKRFSPAPILIFAVVLVLGIRSMRNREEPKEPKPVRPRANAIVPDPQGPDEKMPYPPPKGPEEFVVPGEFWNVRGSALDLIELRAVNGGAVRFTCFHCGVSVEAPITAGTFSANLPKLKTSGYEIFLATAPDGYGGDVVITTTGGLARMSLRDRLFRMENPSGFRTSAEALRGSQSTLELGLKPARQLTQEEHDLLYPPARD